MEHGVSFIEQKKPIGYGAWREYMATVSKSVPCRV